MSMRALVVHGPHDARVDDVPMPEPAAGELLVRVDRAGICGTDVELFTGEMATTPEAVRITRCDSGTSGPAPSSPPAPRPRDSGSVAA